MLDEPSGSDVRLPPEARAGGRRRTLRRRLYTVLVLWFALLVLASGTVVVLSVSDLRRQAVDDHTRLARTIAGSLDTTISTALQDLDRLTAGLPEDADTASARLHVFRLHSPFREATYVLDARGSFVVGDPADARALPPPFLKEHELVTPLVTGRAGARPPVIAIVQPFRWRGAGHYLVSETTPAGSAFNAFLQNLDLGPELHAAVVDERGVVIAAPDLHLPQRTLPRGGQWGARFRTREPLVTETARGEIGVSGPATEPMLTVVVPLRFAPWAVVVDAPQAHVFAGLYATRRGLLAAGLILAIMGGLVTRALWKSVVTPIRELSRQAMRMRAGDLTTPIAVTGDEEAEVLAGTLDEARARLGSTLQQLEALNQDLEGQVAQRTRLIESRYRDLTLLHAVAELSTREREPARMLPEILRLVAGHYGLPAAAILTRPPDGVPVTCVTPPATDLPWLGREDAPPAGWTRRPITYQGQVQAVLFLPEPGIAGDQVLDALEHQIAVSLHGAHLWARTVAQDAQRQVLVRRLLSAAEEERRRLARGLHDETSQLLTVIQLSLDRVETTSPELDKARRLLTATQEEIHRIVHDLRPSLLDDLGLSAAITAHAREHLERPGLAVSLEIEERRPARPEIEITVFRIYQELATNILRHAGAEHVSIELYERDGRLVLAVEDDGTGFDPADKHAGAGITGMRERAALVDGSIVFDSEPGLGTHVVLEIPLT